MADRKPRSGAPDPHDLGGASHGTATLAELNAKVSDATLDDIGGTRTPTAHAASHEEGGGDEINVAGLSGGLADGHTPAAHVHSAADITSGVLVVGRGGTGVSASTGSGTSFVLHTAPVFVTRITTPEVKNTGALLYKLSGDSLLLGSASTLDIKLRASAPKLLELDDDASGPITVQLTSTGKLALSGTAAAFLSSPGAKALDISNDTTDVAVTIRGSLTLTTDLPVTSGGTGVSTSTGTGSVVLSASPTFTGTLAANIITVADGDLTNPAIAFATDPDHGFLKEGVGIIAVGFGGISVMHLGNTVLRMQATTQLGWTAGSSANAAFDTILTRGAADILEMATGDSFRTVSGFLRAGGGAGTADAFIEMDDGATVGVGAAGEVRMRSNAGTFEVSENGGAFAAPGGGGGSLDDAYNNGATITVDAGEIIMTIDGGTIPVLNSDTALVLVNSSAAGDTVSLELIAGTTGNASIFFGDSVASAGGVIAYLNVVDAFTITVASGATAITLLAGSFQINSVSQDVDFNVHGATNDDLLVVDAGVESVTINGNGGDVDFFVEGDTMTHMIYTEGNAASENIALLAASLPPWETMDRGIFLGDGTTAPNANPTAGVFVYVTAGAAQVRGGGGTITEWGPSGLHCEACGSDFWTVASMNMNWKSWCFICGVCDTAYKGGPQNVLDQLTEQQNTELIRATSTWEDVKRLKKLVA